MNSEYFFFFVSVKMKNQVKMSYQKVQFWNLKLFEYVCKTKNRVGLIMSIII